MKPTPAQRRRGFAAALLSAALPLAFPVFAQTKTPSSTTASTTSAALPPGWEEIDQRLVFLTVQLSTVESTIDATNKALRTAGYQQAAKVADANRAEKGNELMDRNGGGPIPWQEYYGKTAQRFYYHSGDDTMVIQSQVTRRPPQFDYIYRANLEAAGKASEDAAKIGTKIEDLLDYRRKLQLQQTALWCKIAFRGVASMELATRPLYRLDLASGRPDDAGKQQAAALKAAAAYLLAVSSELDTDAKSLDDDPRSAFDHLLAATTAARADLQRTLLSLTAIADPLADPKTPIGQFSRSAKRMEDSAQNLVDALRLAADADSRDDQSATQSYRGQFQQTLSDYASAVVTADASLKKAATDWKITPSAAPAVVVQTTPADNSPEAIGPRLDAAKSAWTRDRATARRALVAAIDSRLNAAADAGNLDRVTTLDAAKAKAARDGTIPADLNDDSITAAHKAMDVTIAAADARLVAAYKDAISNYTKARRIADAQAINDELKSSGLLPDSTAATPPSNLTPSTPTPSASSADFPIPALTDTPLEVDFPAAIDEVIPARSGRYLILHLKKLQQLAIFDISTTKILKYIPLPSNNIAYTATDKKLIVGLKDLRQLQRWDLNTLTLELTQPTPPGGVAALAASPSTSGPILMISEQAAKRFWTVDPLTLKADKFPSKNWGTDGSAWGPVHIHVSFDGSTAVAAGGGWAGIEIASLSGGAVIAHHEGGFAMGNVLLSGNGSLVFVEKNDILREDLEAKVPGIEGETFAADDPAFSLAFRKENRKPELTLFSNADPRPLLTLRDLPELNDDGKLPTPQRVHLSIRAHALVTIGTGGDRLLLRKFNLADQLASQGIDYLFVQSSPPSSAERGSRYSYKLVIQSRKGGVKTELQSGPKGMTLARDGTLSWNIPARLDDPSPAVIIQVSDASGQTIFHSFSIELADPTPRRRGQ